MNRDLALMRKGVMRLIEQKVSKMPFGEAVKYFKRGKDGKSPAERERDDMYKRFDRCREPSVQRCLNCDKPDCYVYDGVPLHESEIEAELGVGMIDENALLMHLIRVKRRGKWTHGENKQGTV